MREAEWGIGESEKERISGGVGELESVAERQIGKNCVCYSGRVGY